MTLLPMLVLFALILVGASMLMMSDGIGRRLARLAFGGLVLLLIGCGIINGLQGLAA